jgi:hypothetical protein
MLRLLMQIQDTVPTHTTMLSQRLALHCMDIDDEHTDSCANGESWVDATVGTLKDVREALWPVLEPLGTVKTTG